MGTWRNLLEPMFRERRAGAFPLRGKLERRLWERSRTVRFGDHSGTSGISVSLLWERLRSWRAGSSRMQRGTATSSLCWRSSFIT